MNPTDPNLYSLITTVMLRSENLATPEPQKESELVFFDVFKLLSETNEFCSLLNYLQTLNELEMRLLRISNSTDHLLKKMIHRFYSEFENKSIKIGDDLFNDLYSEFEDYVYGKSIYQNFALTDWTVDEPLTIEDMILRKAKNGEIEELFPQETVQLSFYKLQNYSIIEKTSTEDQSHDAHDKFFNFITTLNLFKNDYGRIYSHTLKNPKFYPVETNWWQSPLVRRSMSNYNYPLLKSVEVKDFVSFYNSYTNLDKPKSLEQSINRYELGMQAHAFEDIILDLMISLECLFGADRELAHTVSIRISLLLGKNEFDTECIRKFMKNVYSVRNGIVHGDDYLKRAKFPLHWMEIKLKKLVNMSILAYVILLEYGKTIEDIKNNLDESISSPRFRKEFQTLISLN